jgi:hypothetical protein
LNDKINKIKNDEEEENNVPEENNGILKVQKNK